MMLFWGSKSIVERIGLRDPRRLPFLIKRWGLPAFLRRAPGHCRNTYYTSEAAITAWEITMSKQYRETLLAKERERAGRGREGARQPRSVGST